MAVPKRYANNYVAVKYMLSSYRALCDGRSGIRHLEGMLSRETVLFSEWRVVWIGVCATIRSSIDLFKMDTRNCLSPAIRNELKREWRGIKNDPQDHEIYWEFVKKERDSIIHEYKWSAYEAWMNPDGSLKTPPTILGLLLFPSDLKPILLMRGGAFDGEDSLVLLKRAADWAEDRIFSAIERAGFDPNEQRSVYNFELQPKLSPDTTGLLGQYLNARS